MKKPTNIRTLILISFVSLLITMNIWIFGGVDNYYLPWWLPNSILFENPVFWIQIMELKTSSLDIISAAVEVSKPLYGFPLPFSMENGGPSHTFLYFSGLNLLIDFSFYLILSIIIYPIYQKLFSKNKQEIKTGEYLG